MGELKRVFSSAVMNKDMDERVVPNGSYREANNVEIATSESSEVGTVQTLLGNTKKDQVYNSTDSFGSFALGANATNILGPHNKSDVVATIADASKDKIYYFVAAGEFSDSFALQGSESNTGETTTPLATNNVAKDYILEYDTVTEKHYYVFVDIYRVYTTVNANGAADDMQPGATTFHVDASASTVDGSGNETFDGATVPPGIRVGMNVALASATNPENIIVTDVQFDTTTSTWEITTDQPHGFADGDALQFDIERTLNFNKRKLITGINILDDFIFWTDDTHEPKKINIPRSIAGTGGNVEIYPAGASGLTFDGNNDYYHTRLVIDKDFYEDAADRYRVVTNSANTHPVYVDESHVTVIRKAPTQPLELQMYRTSNKRVRHDGTENLSYGVISDFSWAQNNGTELFLPASEGGGVITITFDANETGGLDFRQGDILLIGSSDESMAPNTFQDHLIRVVVTQGTTNPNDLTYTFQVRILSISSETTLDAITWYAKLEDKRPMFENRFPRFSYRYKYQDGEYSPFAPFSQIAFLPDYYEYHPKKGYNLGMVNQLRALKLRYFHFDEHAFPQDVVEIDLLYKEAGKPNVYTVKTLKENEVGWPDLSNGSSARGEFELTTDMIHAIVPSNQLLRPYDNVPRKALAQEISANRIIYGNYVQNYTILKDPIIHVGLDTSGLSDIDYDYAAPSVKTMRKYHVGVVFSDRYGRETPVLTSKDATITVVKDYSDTRNRLTCQLDKNTEIPDWAEYFSFYVKETTVEYYTMAMDRWYNAADGNIWLSFPSSERNKLDNETFLILKKAHGSDEAVHDKARYRILAIESEAPDFIKTEKKTLGRLYDNGGGIIGNNGVGYPFQDTNYVRIAAQQFEEVYGDQMHITTPDTLHLKFYGDGQISNEYEISRVSLIGESNEEGSYYQLQIVTKFEEDMAFVSTNGTYAGAISDLSMEILELEVENRPEFDGRFFVKIYKDATLSQYVLTNTAVDYLVESYQNIGYLSTNSYVSTGYSSVNGEVLFNAGGVLFSAGNNEFQDDYGGPTGFAAGVTQSYGYHGANGTSTNINRQCSSSPIHPTEYAHHSADQAIGGQNLAQFAGYSSGAYYWGHDDFATNQASPWATFEDTVANHDDRMAATAIDRNAWLACHSRTDNIQSYDSQLMWEAIAHNRTLFIDAAAAYTYSGYDGDYPGFNAWATVPNFDWATPGYASAAEDGYPGGYDAPSNTLPGGHGLGNGQPSRGIWNHPNHPNISFMDLSWSGMGSWGNSGQSGYWMDSGNWGDATGTFGIVHHLEDVEIYDDNSTAIADTAQYQDAWQFISTLCTPGTQFRFANDPDQTIYTVLEDNFPTITGNGTVGPGYNDMNTFRPGTNRFTGIWGIRNYKTGSWADRDQYTWMNLRQRWTLTVSPRIGSQGKGYSPVKGTNGYNWDGSQYNPVGEYLTEDGNFIQGVPSHFQYDALGQGVPGTENPDYRRALKHDLNGPYDAIQILKEFTNQSVASTFTQKAGVWETEPKESVELDIYYQASGLIPLELNDRTNEELFPIQFNGEGGTTFEVPGQSANDPPSVHTITSMDGQVATFTPALPDDMSAIAQITLNNGVIRFTKRDSYTFENSIAQGAAAGDTTITLNGGPETTDIGLMLFTQTHTLDWSNCYCFGNGVESDRVRDDFNAAQIDNGVKASASLAEQVREERRKHGLIWSGVYNSNSGINDTNQFIAAESITKDLNPVYGSIQKLINRNTRLLVFCEDKVLRAVTNRDALYNADGNPQLVASNTVVGDMTPYLGKYGVAKNPESVATTPSNIYFTDAMRGKVLALGNQGDGIRVISDNGMKDYFGDFFNSDVWRSLGTFDARKKEYNVTISKKYSDTQVIPHEQTTVSYNEASKGWVSFKSFYPTQGVSLNNKYYTFNSFIWEHHSNTNVNNFYDVQYTSDISLIFNDQPENVKSFMTINYEGSKQKIPQFTDVNVITSPYWNTGEIEDTIIGVPNTGVPALSVGVELQTNITDGEYYNLASQTGWYMESLTTNLQECSETYFKNKEDKYFGVPSGTASQHPNRKCDNVATGPASETLLSNIDEREFSVQGIGLANISHDDPDYGSRVCLTITNNTSDTYSGKDSNYEAESDTAWDSTADIASESAYFTCDSVVLTVPGGMQAGLYPPVGSTSNSIHYLTLTPVDPIAFPLSASDFSLGGETAGLFAGTISTYVASNPTSDTNIDINDSVPVGTPLVKFTDTGVPGSPENTVKAQFFPQDMVAGSPAVWPTSDQTLYIDIDYTRPAVAANGRKVCLHTEYTYLGPDPVHPQSGQPIQQLPTVHDVENITATQLQQGNFSWTENASVLGGDPTINVHQGTVVAGVDNIVANITVGPIYYGPNFQGDAYDPQPDPNEPMPYWYYMGNGFESQNPYNHVSGFFSNLGAYEPYYSWQIVDPVYVPVSWSLSQGDNAVILVQFTIQVLYNPPPADVLPDIDNMCLIGDGGPHKFTFRYNVKDGGFAGAGTDAQGLDIPDITGVSFLENVNYEPRNLGITVRGQNTAEYRLFVTQSTSTTDNTPAAYYNFETRSFQAGEAFEQRVIGGNGTSLHDLCLPENSSDVYYSVFVQGISSVYANREAVLKSTVPTAPGDATIRKYGIKTITLQTVTDTDANFGTRPTLTIRRPARFEDDYVSIAGPQDVIPIKGGTKGKASNKIRIETRNAKIRKGMVVFTPFKNSGIPFGTIVTNVEEDLVQVNQDVTIADSTKLTFMDQRERFSPFSLTIPKGPNRLVLNDSADFKQAFDIATSATTTLTSAATDTKVIPVASTRGVRVGMKAVATGITEDIFVSSISGSNVNVDKGVTLDDESTIEFTYSGNTISDRYDGPQDGITLIHAQTSIDDGDLKVQGYFNITHISKDADTIDIYLDDLVTIR